MVCRSQRRKGVTFHVELENAKQMPKVYYTRHMYPGLCEYSDERILVDENTIKKMMPSFVGKPVYAENHRKVDVDNLQAEADGYVTDSFRNGLDGWAWSKFIVVSDAGHEAVRKGYKVSNAWKPKTWDASSGTFHNVKYDRKITDGEFTHLALVKDPRYEESKIYTESEYKAYVAGLKTELHNSKTNPPEGKSMFDKLKFWKTSKEEVQMDKTMTVELENGKTVTIEEMLNAVEAQEKAATEAAEKEAKEKADKEKADAEKTNEVDLGAEIEINGTTMTIGMLKQKFMQLQKEKEKKNASDDDAAEAARIQKEADDKKAADAAAAEAAEKKKKHDELQNAGDRTTEKVQTLDTAADQSARGASRYGSNK